jgi:hypothetical protein
MNPNYKTMPKNQLPKAVVPKACFADPMGSATSSQGIRGYIHVVATLNFNVLLKNNSIGGMFILIDR